MSVMNAFYSYKIARDFGFAPNPFGGYCTLANCKPKIRRKAEVGDWIIGCGSCGLKNLHHIIYVMQITEKLTYNQYWNDSRFQYKKPLLNGSLTQIHGDNIYYQDDLTEVWYQANSHHSLEDGGENEGNRITDTGGKHVLISDNFYYFGRNHFEVPDEFKAVTCGRRDRDFISKKIPSLTGEKFIQWLKKNQVRGIHGDPLNWKLCYGV
jgi:hypothetical protein